MAYELEGSILEVCDCNILCPCWVGGDPDNGTCKAILAYHIEKGTINGIDVSGLTMASCAFIPGNILQGNIRVLVAVDERATPEQQEAWLNAYTGKLDGPLAKVAKLFGEVVAVERLPITFTVEGGKGRLTIGALAEAEMAPLMGATGQPTTLHDSVFSTIPGSPAYVAKADYFRAYVPALNMDVDLQGHNAIQGSFKFVG
jgi:hypothetical protein